MSKIDPQSLGRRAQKVPVTRRRRETSSDLARARRKPQIPHTIFRTLVWVRAELSQWFVEDLQRLGRRTQKVPVTRRRRETSIDLVGTRREPPIPHPSLFSGLSCGCGQSSASGFSKILNVSAGGRRKPPLPEGVERPPTTEPGRPERPRFPTQFCFPDSRAGAGRTQPVVFRTSSTSPPEGATLRRKETPNTLAGARREPPISHTNFLDSRAGAGRTQPWCGGGGFSKILNVSAGGRRKSPLPEDAERPPTPQP